jgi:hypothetical protein
MATRVYLHVGPPKTGTSYLQGILWHHSETLQQRGLLLPGSRHDHFRAVVDVLDSAVSAGDKPKWSQGAWARLVEEISAWDGDALVSRETLAGAPPRRVRQIVADLAPAQVHVVLTVRDLARAVPAVWQQRLKRGGTESLEDFTARVMADTAQFHRAQFPEVVAARWARRVPAEQIHVVTLPPPGAPSRLLWERFGGLFDIADLPIPDQPKVNSSLGAAEAELLRRVNTHLAPHLTKKQASRWVRVELANNVLAARDSRRIALDGSTGAWLAEHARQSVRELEAGGYDVRGDLADLLPTGDPEPHEATDAEMLAAATETIAEMLLKLRAAHAQS